MANTIYPNVVLENQYESVLTTLLDLQQFLTVDASLEAQSGMKKRIIKKTVSGSVEDLAMTEGNSETIEVSTTYKDYDVGTTQGRFIYYDEEALQDANLVEAGLKGLAEKMVNDFVAKAVAEWRDASKQQAYSSTITFSSVVDAIALMNLENEDGLWMLISPAQVAAFRKALGDELKYVEAFVRSGYIGSVCGVPVYVSKAIPAGEAIIGTKEAVRLFMKKGTEIEQQRDPNTRKNTIYSRKVALVALVDDRKLVRIAGEPATATTITTYTKNAKTVAGAASTGATVEIYINGVLDGTATAAASAYTYTAKENLAAGDEIKVVAKKEGMVDSAAEVEVAE